jgi:hypothetical protein
MNVAKLIMDSYLFFSLVGGRNVFDGKVETNAVSSLVFTVFVGILGVPSMLGHCVFGFCILVDMQQLVYTNRMAMSNVGVRAWDGVARTGGGMEAALACSKTTGLLLIGSSCTASLLPTFFTCAHALGRLRLRLSLHLRLSLRLRLRLYLLPACVCVRARTGVLAGHLHHGVPVFGGHPAELAASGVPQRGGVSCIQGYVPGRHPGRRVRHGASRADAYV